MDMQSFNPTTEEILSTYRPLTQKACLEVIDSAHLAYQGYQKESYQYRGQLLLKLACLLRTRSDTYAQLMAKEMGKPIALGRAEIEKCAFVCDYFAKETEQLLAERVVDIGMRKSLVCYEPMGVLLAIMPWNFPFWQVFRFAAPNVMAGNAVILKHAPNVFGCGQAIASLFLDAGFPVGLFQNVIVDIEGVKDIIAHPHIVGVTLTGSEQAGKQVASYAGSQLKKVVLELGGNDPYIVLEDADLESAALAIVTSRLSNSGQVCIAAKRVITLSAVKEDLIARMKNLMQSYQMGDPLDEATQMGPMARHDLRDILHKQVCESIQRGATLCMGGVIPNKIGYFYPPTMLTEVKPGMPAFDDELFGPVVSVVEATSEKEAISLANQSRFGLGACVFTADIKRGEEIARHQIETGMCYVNAMVASHPYLPFGGVKHSGFGRELSKEGLLEFVNIKTVSVC